MDQRSEIPQTQQLTRCENRRNEKRVSMDGRSQKPWTQQLTSCENTRNEKKLSMDGRSDTDTATYIL